MELPDIAALEALGYIGILTFFVVAMVVVFLPSELSIAYLGFRAATEIGFLPGIILTAVLGVTTGMTILYLVGKHIKTGRIYQLVDKYGRFFRISSADLEESAKWLQTHHSKVVFGGQLLPAARFGLGLIAGIYGFPLKTFITYTALGAFVWVTAFACFGYFFQESYHEILDYYEFVIGAGAVIAAGALAYLWYQRRPGV